MDTTLTPTAYDNVPYPSGAYPQSHPRRLATLGALFGMQPADILTARVLELGAADGSNLIPMAAELPQATFVGIERAGIQARTGQATIKELGLRTITLLHRDMLDVDAQLGQFDYIIAHGVFSWVPGEVQDKTLSICKQNLEPNGIAYVSYNTYPGWHMRGMMRDMMLFHTSQFTDPQTKVQQARALVEFLADSVPTKNNPYGLWLTQELKNMQGGGHPSVLFSWGVCFACAPRRWAGSVRGYATLCGASLRGTRS
jgi:SAM-dependent methyltransferase